MKINKLNVNKKLIALAMTSTLVLSLSGCNKQIVDFNKSFNIALEPNGDNISVVSIAKYADYEGSQVQFETLDGLVVLSSTHQLELLKVDNNDILNNYVQSIKDDNDKVIYYDNNINNKVFNKKLIDLNYVFNKAIILKDDSALIVELDKWKDYEDDKIQLKLKDGTCILTEIDNVKLINDSNAEEDSLERYVTSLVGSYDKINYYDAKAKVKTK